MNLSVTILFPVSSSKFYKKVLRLASEFKDFRQKDLNEIVIGELELFEKWEYFNLLFWKVVDWKGTILEYDGVKYQSHTDKTRIFYALQYAHSVHICEQVQKIKELKQVYSFDGNQKDLAIMFN